MSSDAILAASYAASSVWSFRWSLMAPKPVSGPQALLDAAEHHWDRWVDTGRLPASETVQSVTQNLSTSRMRNRRRGIRANC